MIKKKLFYVALLFGAATLSWNVPSVHADDTSIVAYSQEQIYTDEDSAASYINEQIMAHIDDIRVTLSDKMCSDESPRTVFERILDNVPMHYETAGMSYYYNSTSEGVIFYISPRYKTTDEENALFSDNVSDILEELDIDNKSDYEKVRLIHDYICDNVDYDFDYKKYTAYEALMTGEAVCQGYANLFYYMCYEAGVSSNIISGIGNGGDHAWNIVKIGDEYYNIDTTWDGQEQQTYYNYFLKNESDFWDHIRDDKYATKEYYDKYVMAENSWIDFESLGGGYNLDNLAAVELDTLDGTDVVNQAENGRPRLLIMGDVNCGYTCQTLSNISQAEFDDIDIVVIEANIGSLDGMEWMKENYGHGNDDIIYAYTTDYRANMMMWDYARVVGFELDTYPLLIYIDADNTIRYADKSMIYSAAYIRSVIDTWVKSDKEGGISKQNVSLYKGASTQLSIEVLGIERNPQFFAWKSSDTSVATVDYNGKVRAVGAGTATITCKVSSTISLTCNVTVKDFIVSDGLNKDIEGNWCYFKNGSVDTSYTGMAQNKYGWWYVKSGRLDTTYTGMAQNKYGWWYMKNGKLDTSYTGMAQNKYGWWYMKNGKLDTSYTGMAQNKYGWWYIKNGKLDTTYTGMAKNQYGWWYMKNGKLDTTYTGMAKNQYGWWHMTKGKLDTSFTGISTNAYGKWYIKKGKLDTSYTGTLTFNGKTYNIKSGKVTNP